MDGPQSATSSAAAEPSSILSTNEKLLAYALRREGTRPPPEKDATYGWRSRRSAGFVNKRKYTDSHVDVTAAQGAAVTAALAASIATSEQEALGNVDAEVDELEEHSDDEDDALGIIMDVENSEDEDDVATGPVTGLAKTNSSRKQNRSLHSPEELAAMPEKWQLNPGAPKRLDRQDPCQDCDVPITSANWAVATFVKTKRVNHYGFLQVCRSCHRDRERFKQMFSPMKRLQTKVSALAARINQDFGQNFLTPGRAFTDHVASLNDPQASKDVTIIVRNAWILALQAGDKGINGADAFRTGVSPRALAMFKADLPQSHYACARTGVEFNWLAGNGSSRPSIDKEIFISDANKKKHAPPYFSKKQHLAIVSFAWNEGGLSQAPRERTDGYKQTALTMSKSKKLEMWAGRADFIKAVKALGEVRIRDINELKEVLNRIGIVEPSYTWDDWNRAIAISSKCLHNQEKSRVKGRVYAQPPSTREQLALFILYGRYDAITGQELPVKLRSLDALLCANGHCLDNAIVVSNERNVWKSVYFPWYSNESLEEWHSRSDEGAKVNRTGYTRLQRDEALLELHWTDFLFNVLKKSSELYEDVSSWKGSLVERGEEAFAQKVDTSASFDTERRTCMSTCFKKIGDQFLPWTRQVVDHWIKRINKD